MEFSGSLVGKTQRKESLVRIQVTELIGEEFLPL